MHFLTVHITFLILYFPIIAGSKETQHLYPSDTAKDIDHLDENLHLHQLLH